jgi:hypothetical protein
VWFLQRLTKAHSQEWLCYPAFSAAGYAFANLRNDAQPGTTPLKRAHGRCARTSHALNGCPTRLSSSLSNFYGFAGGMASGASAGAGPTRSTIACWISTGVAGLSLLSRLTRAMAFTTSTLPHSPQIV